MRFATSRTRPPNTTSVWSPSASTETGDAWLLDVTDKLAVRLARDGDPEPIHLEETDTTFAIGWKGNYRIDGPTFVYSDRKTGRVTTIIGYPTKKIAQMG